MTKRDKEIEHAAGNMIERYGSSAPKEVDLRIMELEARNQPEALELWREIKNRVELLMQVSGDSAKH